MSYSPEPRKGDGPKHSEADAIFLGAGVVIAILLVDGFFKAWLYQHSPALYWAFDIAKFVLVPALVLGWLYRSHSVVPARYGLKPFGRGEQWFRTIGLTLLLSFLLAVVYHFTSRFGWRITAAAPAAFSYQASVPDGWLHYPVVLYYAATAGFVEEVFLRGLPLLYLQSRYGNKVNRIAYVAVTSLLFGLIHWENGVPEVVATAAFGVVAAVVYLRIRNLWPLIVAHALIDVWGFN